MSPKTIKLPKNLDHLVFTAPSLEQGMDYIEDLLGVRPVPGGQHPDYGTHNALLSLGSDIYLEVIAPDPSLNIDEAEILFKDYFQEKPRLARWVLRTEKIDDVISAAEKNGLSLGDIQSGSRKKPDGVVLTWRLSDPSVIPLAGAVPFLISWGNTPHPAHGLPAAGEIVGFRVEHPDIEMVTHAFSVLDIDAEIKPGNEVKLVATIKIKKGLIELY